MTICMNFIRKNLWSVQLLHHKDFQESVTKVFARMQRFLESHNAGDLFSDSVVVSFTLLTQEFFSRAGVLSANTRQPILYK